MGTPPTSWLQIAGLIVTWVAIVAGGLWWIVSGYPKLRGELQQEIERLFAAGSLREQVKTMIAEEIARRVMMPSLSTKSPAPSRPHARAPR